MEAFTARRSKRRRADEGALGSKVHDLLVTLPPSREHLSVSQLIPTVHADMEAEWLSLLPPRRP